jgi:hypothetical protein
MDKKLKKKWVKELLSGRYVQGVGELHNRVDRSYCCLGVLCVAAGATSAEIADYSYPWLLPKYKHVIDKSVGRRLAMLNDEGIPFDMIAGLVDDAL